MLKCVTKVTGEVKPDDVLVYENENITASSCGNVEHLLNYFHAEPLTRVIHHSVVSASHQSHVLPLDLK